MGYVADLTHIKEKELKEGIEPSTLTDTSFAKVRSQTTALQRIGVNLYRYMMSVGFYRVG